MVKKITCIAICFSIIFTSCGKDKPLEILDDDKEKEIADDPDSVVRGERDPFAGVYAIWYGNNQAVLNSKYLKGGQIMVQWKDCEPQEGIYNFSLLNSRLADMAQRGLKTTVQVNGNSKPDYLFDSVPYLPRQVHVQVSDEKGSLMYWHPYFTQAYLNFIDAYAKFIKESQYKDIIVGIRQNFNSFGTELSWIEGLYALEESEWVIPPGVTYVKPSSTETRIYEEKVLAQFISSFSPDVRVFYRSAVDDKFIEENMDMIENQMFGIFQTGAAMEQNQRYEQVTRYDKFIKYCKPGITVGFSELISGRVQPYSEIQWQYWRVLSELHCGISYIGTRAVPFEKAHIDKDPGFIRILEFAEKYVGYHALPSESPGAWYVFRGKGDNFPWDYTFLMNSIESASLTDLKLVGNNNVPYGAWAQRLGIGSKIYLDIDDDFFADKKSSNGISATIRVIYFDSSVGSWSVKYDSADDSEKIAKMVTNQNTQQWKILDIPISDGHFENRCLGKADIVIENSNAEDCTLHMVEILRR